MACDQYWGNVSALLHFDGSDGSVTFTDETGKTWTASGNAQIDTAQSKFGGAAGLFDGVGDYISTPNVADFRFGTGDYTVEMWVYNTSRPGGGVSNDMTLFGTLSGSGYLFFYLDNTTGNPTCWNGTSGVTSTIAVPLNTWTHVAFSRASGTLRIYVDGVEGAAATHNLDNSNSTETFKIGGDAGGYGSRYFYGSIDELRITKGVARYTSAFTPASSAFSSAVCVDLAGTVDAAAATDAALSVTRELAGGAEAAADVAGTLENYLPLQGTIDAAADVAGTVSITKNLAGTVAGAADANVLDAITTEEQSLSRATAPIRIDVRDSGTATAPIKIEVIASTGTAMAPIRIDVRDSGTATAPIAIAVVDSLAVARWTATASIGGVDVSSLLTGVVEVRMEEGASRTATFTLDVVSTPLNPLSYVGQSVAIDLVRVVGGVSVTSPLFRGVVETPSYQPRAASLTVECSQDLQHIVAALDRTSINSLTGGGYHRAAHGDIDDNWDYAQACMQTQAASLDCGVMGNPRKTAWDGLAVWRTFGTGDIDEPDIEVTFPRRADLVNRVNCTFEYRYTRLRERHYWVSWSASYLDAHKHGAQYPTVQDIEAAINGTGWQIVGGVYYGLPDRVPYADGYVEIPSTACGNAQVHCAQRHSQTVTETHTLTVSAPKSIDNSGTIAHEMRGALASEWKAEAWESDIAAPLSGVAAAEQTPFSGGFTDGYTGGGTTSANTAASFSSLPSGYAGGNLEIDWAPDATRTDAEAGIGALLNMARVKILGSHRLARVSAQTDILPELDVDRAVGIDITSVQAEGKVAAVSHTLNLETGAAVTRFSIAVSGIGAAGVVSETPIAAPSVDTDALLLATVGDDDYTVPAYGTWRAGETPYQDTLMGWLVNPPQTIEVVDVPVTGGGTTTKTVVNPWYTTAGYDITGFRAQMPGVANALRNPAQTDVAADYDVQVPEDTFVI